jgi:hypothetical protein
MSDKETAFTVKITEIATNGQIVDKSSPPIQKVRATDHLSPGEIEKRIKAKQKG